MVNLCKEYNIKVSAIVSDNAPALVAAIMNNDPDDENSLLSIVGDEILRASCAVHTAQLAIKDLMKTQEMTTFFEQVIGLLNWLQHRKALGNPVFPKKLPSFVSTRWNTLFQCSKFLYDTMDELKEFINEVLVNETERYSIELDAFNSSRRKKTPPTEGGNSGRLVRLHQLS